MSDSTPDAAKRRRKGRDSTRPKPGVEPEKAPHNEPPEGPVWVTIAVGALIAAAIIAGIHWLLSPPWRCRPGEPTLTIGRMLSAGCGR